jgi:hypothetical protein
MKMSLQRNTLLDFIKGACVIGMILYHSIVLFFPDSFALHYLLFITGSFIFITGFILTGVYPHKYDLTRDSRFVAAHLAVRGLKLFLIFVAANIAIMFIFHDSNNPFIYHEKAPWWLFEVFVIGSYELAAFELLLIIAYFLCGLGLFFLVFKNRKDPLVYLSIGLFAISNMLLWYGKSYYNFDYFTVGCIGAAFGLVSLQTINAFVMKHRMMLIGVIVFYNFLITFTRLYFPIDVLTIILNLLLFFIIGDALSNVPYLYDKIVLIGKYSLVSYLSNICFLRLVKVFIPEETVRYTHCVGLMLVTVVVVYYISNIIDLNRRHKVFNVVYKTIFN